MLFFHGATSWILSDLNKPYCVYLDADVKTYVDVYQSSNNFRKKQLDFIYRKESEFLNKADKVFFTSEWAQNQAVKNLGLIGDNLMVLPPNAEPQFSKIIYDKANYILFVGHDFIGKGGNYVAQAIKKYNDCNELKMRLKIVGQLPPSDILSEDFVDYVGRIDKSKISDQKKLAELYQNAMCFIMPTSRDMTPLVLLEAMSFGCPVISMDKFGISEMLKGGSAGLLIQTDFDIIGQLVDSLHKIIKDVSLRKALIDAGSIQVRSKYSREKTYQLLLKTINKIK
jgi:glycosyltransferase involved in cell wall biosynthesis